MKKKENYDFEKCRRRQRPHRDDNIDDDIGSDRSRDNNNKHHNHSHHQTKRIKRN